MARLVLLLSALMVLALAVDASAFGGQYRRGVWREAGRQYQRLQYNAARYSDRAYF
jgi:hypothetical protein